MLERLSFGEPRRIAKESEEPHWPAFDNAAKAVFSSDRRSILRILHAQDQPIAIDSLSSLVGEYRLKGKLASSSLFALLKELDQSALVKRDGGQYSITDEGRDFLAAYDRIREALAERYHVAMRQKAQELFPTIDR